MKILRVTKQPPSEQELITLAANDLVVEVLSPTPLSALTAMKVYKRAQSARPAIVVVSRQKDALAAISAKKLGGYGDYTKYKVIYLVEPNTAVPTVLHDPVVRGVDCWVFMSQRLHDLYPKELRRKVVVPAVGLDAQRHEPPSLEGTKAVTIAWIGDIKDTERLKAAIAKVDELDGRMVLRISGGGTARHVMPAVRYARTLKHADKVVWNGEDYDQADEIAQCHAAVRSAEDITRIETEVLLSGREVIDIDDIAEFIDKPRPGVPHPELSAQRQAQRLRTICLETQSNEVQQR